MLKTGWIQIWVRFLQLSVYLQTVLIVSFRVIANNIQLCADLYFLTTTTIPREQIEK